MGFAENLNTLLMRLRLAEVACFAPQRLTFAHGTYVAPVECVPQTDLVIEMKMRFRKQAGVDTFDILMDGDHVRTFNIDPEDPPDLLLTAIVEIGLPEPVASS